MVRLPPTLPVTCWLSITAPLRAVSPPDSRLTLAPPTRVLVQATSVPSAWPRERLALALNLTPYPSASAPIPTPTLPLWLLCVLCCSAVFWPASSSMSPSALSLAVPSARTWLPCTVRSESCARTFGAAGELRHLLGGERHPGAQLDCCVGDACVHQRTVLLFVAGVALQEAVPGELGHLLAHQALFVEAVAQAFLGCGGVESERLKQVVGAEPLAVIREARIGFDQDVRAGRRVLAEQACRGQRQVGRRDTHDRASLPALRARGPG